MFHGVSFMTGNSFKVDLTQSFAVRGSVDIRSFQLATGISAILRRKRSRSVKPSHLVHIDRLYDVPFTHRLEYTEYSGAVTDRRLLSQ